MQRRMCKTADNSLAARRAQIKRSEISIIIIIIIIIIIVMIIMIIMIMMMIR